MKIGLLIVLTSVLPAFAQQPLDSETVGHFNWVFEKSSAPTLDCDVITFKPFLDFAFRFEAGYIIHCSLEQFEGQAAMLGTLLRVTPEKGPPVTLGQQFKLPSLSPEERAKLNWRHVHNNFEISGVFLMGEGRCPVELALLDNRSRIYRKSWHVEAYLHGKEAKAPLILKPGTVSAISFPPWEGASGDKKGLRITVLVDAAPMNPAARKIHAWDRAFLLGSVSSVLRKLPLSSVRLVAFNLEQQREVFRDDDFDRTDLRRLSTALSDLELGSVSFQVLQRPAGWSDLLVNLLNREAQLNPAADAVIFLGPHNRIDREIPPEFLTKAEALRLYYFEYYPQRGSDFPDTIQRLISAQKGLTLKLHSPGDLAEGLEKMRKHLEQTGVRTQTLE